MNQEQSGFGARSQAFLLDWLIWAYLPAAILYMFREPLSELPFVPFLYLGAIVLGLVVALVLGRAGTTVGQRLLGLAPEEPLEERGKTKRPPWYSSQIGWTAVLLAVVTFVLGWQITEINLYYVFTRAEKMQNMTDRLLRPQWSIFGSLIEKMIETIFLALMATFISIPLAVLVSFLAARNIMYRLTTRWGQFLTGVVFAVAGAYVGLSAVRLLLAPLQNSNLDIKLLRGLLSPLFLLVGIGVASYLGVRLVKQAFAIPRPGPAKGLTILLSLLLGVGGAYLAASTVATVVFAASWRIFVRDYGPWPYVVLACGALGGVVHGARSDPRAEFASGRLIYGVIRFILNATRSIEPFVWALIFVTWFRLGPFPGMVALLVHSVAALGKLYSEQIESIDPGPLEAVRSAGASELQTVVYAVIPQIVPPFISFTIYRWDINVRMSTIIGLVGGGGIGQMLFQFQNLGQWRKTSVAVILIVAVVMTLDNVSARIRERIL